MENILMIEDENQQYKPLISTLPITNFTFETNINFKKRRFFQLHKKKEYLFVVACYAIC